MYAANDNFCSRRAALAPVLDILWREYGLSDEDRKTIDAVIDSMDGDRLLSGAIGINIALMAERC